uniref:C-mannosyltransferase dpy-19 n=1 Tax=Romanomermis culicivorax TaxID=13658 RepID=A0A915L3G7_ROMCU
MCIRDKRTKSYELRIMAKFKKSKLAKKEDFGAASEFSEKAGPSSNLWLTGNWFLPHDSNFFAHILAIGFGIANRYHVANMFENDRHFSYLSDLEREMTFRTEMGLYYSYFKTLVKAPSLSNGLSLIIKDNVTEAGHTINTLKRFNLYPELVIAWMYKVYMHVAASYNITTQECWETNRGQGLDPIVSCEGMGNQFYFYVNMVFVLWGLVGTVLFLYGVLLSGSIFGGLITIASFFFNHGEATRVQWTPPLRESFGYPFCLTLMLILTYMLKFKKFGAKWTAFISCVTVCFMISWQFASFVLSTQVGCIFVVYVLGYARGETLKSVTHGFLIGLATSFVLLFGNEMLLTSLFFSSLITLLLILSIERFYQKLYFRPVVVFMQILSFAVGTLSIKFLFGQIFHVKDDAHVFDILRSKFTDYSDFHTRLYTCAAEFDFLGAETFWKLAYTLLLPVGLILLLLIAVLFLKQEFNRLMDRSKSFDHGEILYNTIQLVVFTMMAVIIMRLKLFFTPHLCILASLLASKELFNAIFGGALKRGVQNALCILLLALMAVEGVKNIQSQLSIMGEYSNPQQEQLFNWISKNTAKDAVFAGPMPTMANLKLSTGRPIVNHPHYEDVGIRERTKKVYSIFSRKSHDDVYGVLKNMGVNYIIFEYGWCRKSTNLLYIFRPGCSMPELFDLDDPTGDHSQTPLCEKIQKESAIQEGLKCRYRGNSLCLRLWRNQCLFENCKDHIFH